MIFLNEDTILILLRSRSAPSHCDLGKYYNPRHRRDVRLLAGISQWKLPFGEHAARRRLRRSSCIPDSGHVHRSTARMVPGVLMQQELRNHEISLACTWYSCRVLAHSPAEQEEWALGFAGVSDVWRGPACGVSCWPALTVLVCGSPPAEIGSRLDYSIRLPTL